MEHQLRRLLTEVSLEELPRMTDAEILSRIEAMRELSGGRDYLWGFTAGNAAMLAEMGEAQIHSHSGRASFPVHLLRKELRAITVAKNDKNVDQAVII